MSQRIGREREKALLREVAGGGDLRSIAARHRMTGEALAQWVCRPEHRRVLSAMCSAADLQVEVALSQFRMHAVTRLLELTTAREAQKGDETIRRACNDVLKLRTPTGRDDAQRGDADTVSPEQVVAAIDACYRECEATAGEAGNDRPDDGSLPPQVSAKIEPASNLARSLGSFNTKEGTADKHR